MELEKERQGRGNYSTCNNNDQATKMSDLHDNIYREYGSYLNQGKTMVERITQHATTTTRQLTCQTYMTISLEKWILF